MENTTTIGHNRAKQWQIALFPFNNAATNVYFAFYNYFVYWAVLYLTGSVGASIGGVLISAGIAIAVSTFASLFAPLMRVFDGVTDPILGGMMDKTKTKFGKFRPFMVIGNVMLAISVLLMMMVSRVVPNDVAWLQWTFYIVSYIIYVLGYTCQCAVTKAGQTCLTNDPKQRSQFVIWNMIGMIGSIVLVNVLAGGVLTNEAICSKGLIVYEQTASNVYSARELLEKLAADFLSLPSAAGVSTNDLIVQLKAGGIDVASILSTGGISMESFLQGGQSYVYALSEGLPVITRADAYTVNGLVETLSVQVLNVKDVLATYRADSILDIPTVQLIPLLLEKGIDINGLNLTAGQTYTYLRGAAYGAQFYNIMVPFVIIVSGIYTVMAVAAIWEKDNPKYWGISEKPAKMKDYVGILKGNKEIRWLVLSSGLNKLASTVATSGAVAFLLYGCLMGDYNGLYIPFYALCFVFMGVFFLWGSKTAGRKGQKRGVAQFTIFAFLFYIGVLLMLCIYNHDNPATWLSLYRIDDSGFHLTINAYTIIFIILYGCGYGAFNCCDNLTIPMVADCTDYETYRSGNYVPGIMGTIFSLVDKLISAANQLLLQLFIVFLVPGLSALPGESTPYMDGMQLSCIICFCVLPMLAWAVTIFCMTRYSLSGKRLEEIQAVNAVRKAAVEGGMSMSLAMDTWKTIDQVPMIFVPKKKPVLNKKTGEVIEEKENFMDKMYNKLFTKRENATVDAPSSHAIDIPEEYLTEEVRAIVNAHAENNEKSEE